MGTNGKHLLEFGPFRIDPEQRLLLRDRQPVPLTPKAFDLLLVLTQHSGKVVLKEELMKALWPDTFVEESNLGQHVFQLRKALGEKSQDNSFIITVPGRGYRFVQKVRPVTEPEEAYKEETDEQIVVASRSLAKVVVQGQPGKDWRPFFVAGVALVAILVAGGLYWRLGRKPKLTEKDTVVLGDFTNSTGDTVFDNSLRQGLAAQLMQSPFLNLLSDSRTVQTLALMSRPKDTPLTPELALEVCQRTQSTATLSGSIAQIGTRYLLTLKAVACANGELLASTEAQASDKNHVLDALGEIGSEIRPKLGESLTSVEKYDVPLPEVSTGSLEALKAYALGRRALFAFRSKEAIPFYQRAISLDPNFAAPYEALAVVYFNEDETSLAAENMQKAYDLRGHLGEDEKLFIEMAYESTVTRNFEAAVKSGLLYTQMYPRQFAGYTNLAVAYSYVGDSEKELAANQKAMELNPGVSANYSNLVSVYLQLNRLTEAEAVAADARNHKLDSPYLHELLYLVEFVKHDTAAMEREAAHRPAGDLITYFQSDTAAYGGQFAKARELTDKAMSTELRAGQKETAAEYEAEAAVREALVGNLAQAKRQAKAALALSTGKEIVAMSRIALGLAGDPEGSRLGEDLAKRFPEDTALNYNLLPSARAATALGNRDPEKAIAMLAVSSPYELGGTMQEANFWLYSVYLRGEAYLAAKRGAAAVTEFQKIIDHPGLVVNEPIGALAHLGLGRAYVLSRDSTKAKTEYQNFRTLWKDADPDIPILQQANAECAKFQ